MRIKAYSIQWDVTSEDRVEDLMERIENDDAAPPSTVILTLPDNTDQEEIADLVSDMISDKYGYCHNGFVWDILPEENGE